jgi:hypothetical protein
VKKTPVLCVSAAVVILFCAYTAKHFYSAKHAAAEVAQFTSYGADSGDAEVSAATPDDPGKVTVVGPMAVWMREAHERKVRRASASSDATQAAGNGIVPSQKLEKSLHVEFALNKDTQFTFVIPPHTISPRLHGTFEAYVTDGGPETSNQAARIDVELMSPQQYDDFQQGRPGDAIFEVESADRMVDYVLPSAYDQPQEYHLLFRDDAGRANLFVEADFVVTAE